MATNWAVRYDTDHVPLWYQSRMDWFTPLDAAVVRDDFRQKLVLSFVDCAVALHLLVERLRPINEAAERLAQQVRIIQEREAADASRRGFPTAYGRDMTHTDAYW